MKRTVPFVLLGVLALAGCGGDDEPAAMPTPEDSLSTKAAPPPEDTQQTSDAPDDEATTTSAPPDDEKETLAPPSADIDEDSEAGAEAFARHYIDLINQTGMEPEEGVLEPLSGPNCETCANFAVAVIGLAEEGHRYSGPVFEVTRVDPLVFPDEAAVTVEAKQLAVDVLDVDGTVVTSEEASHGTMRFDLSRTDGDRWVVDGIAVGEAPDQ